MTSEPTRRTSRRLWPIGMGAAVVLSLSGLTPAGAEELSIPAEPHLLVSIACEDGGMLVTITNDGDADGATGVLNHGQLVRDLVVPARGVATVLVPVAEDEQYSIDVTAVGVLVGPRHCGPAVPTTVAPIVPVRAPVEVLGVQIDRAAPVEAVRGQVDRTAPTLPRTGNENRTLGLVGGGLVLAGMAAIGLGRATAAGRSPLTRH